MKKGDRVQDVMKKKKERKDGESAVREDCEGRW